MVKTSLPLGALVSTVDRYAAALSYLAWTILQWGRKRAKIYSGSWGFQTVFCVVTLITPQISIRDLGAASNSAGPCPRFHRIYQRHLNR